MDTQLSDVEKVLEHAQAISRDFDLRVVPELDAAEKYLKKNLPEGYVIDRSSGSLMKVRETGGIFFRGRAVAYLDYRGDVLHNVIFSELSNPVYESLLEFLEQRGIQPQLKICDERTRQSLGTFYVPLDVIISQHVGHANLLIPQ